MRSSALVVAAIVIGLGGTAEAKRMACAPPLPMNEVGRARIANDDDRAPPVTPVVRGVGISERTLYIDATFSDDTALVEIQIVDAMAQRFVLWTTPRARLLCLTGDVSPGSAVVSVAAHDSAGNASSAIATAEVGVRSYRRCGCGLASMVLILVAPIALIGGAIALLVVLALRRRKLRLPGEPVPPLVAEAIARLVLHRNVLALGAGIATVLVFRMIDWYGSALLASMIPLTAITRVMASRKVLRVLEHTTEAALHDTLLSVGGKHLQASRAVVRAAQAHAVPASTIAR